MKSKPEEDEVELVDDFKDLELELMAGSREKTLWWMKHYD